MIFQEAGGRRFTRGNGSKVLIDLMEQSQEILKKKHPVNTETSGAGKLPATQIWLFWWKRPRQLLCLFKDAIA